MAQVMSSLNSASDRIVKPIFVLQRILPDYREGFYAALKERLPNPFVVTNGIDKFTQALGALRKSADWILPIKNTYLLGNRLLWQSGHLRKILDTPLLVAELNPRILSTWLVLLLRRLLFRPSVVWGHSRSLGERHPLIASLRFWQCRLAGAVLAYTSTQAEEFRIRLPKLLVFVAPNSCVSTRECAAYQGAAAVDVLYVGRLIPEKKVDLLLKGFAAVAKRLPLESKLKLVGDGPERPRLEALAAESGSSQRIEFLGHVTDETTLNSLYAGAACSVSPGYAGLSVIQSLAHGVPILVAVGENHSPEIEACIDNTTARFFGSDSVEALGNEFILFFENLHTWQARRTKIADFIANQYTFEVMALSFVAMANTLVPQLDGCEVGRSKL
jgi:glycosyltransferase involved in cell wall biosynthesis